MPGETGLIEGRDRSGLSTKQEVESGIEVVREVLRRS